MARFSKLRVFRGRSSRPHTRPAVSVTRSCRGLVKSSALACLLDVFLPQHCGADFKSSLVGFAVTVFSLAIRSFAASKLQNGTAAGADTRRAHAADCWDPTVAELARQATELRVLAVDLPVAPPSRRSDELGLRTS